jgi:hypothetical protein
MLISLGLQFIFVCSLLGACVERAPIWEYTDCCSHCLATAAQTVPTFHIECFGQHPSIFRIPWFKCHLTEQVPWLTSLASSAMQLIASSHPCTSTNFSPHLTDNLLSSLQISRGYCWLNNSHNPANSYGYLECGNCCTRFEFSFLTFLLFA